MNNSQKFLAACRVLNRQMSSTPTVARYTKLQAIQKHLGVDNGVPVFLKSGLGDKAIYGTTVLLTLTGIGLSLETFYILTFGKKE